MGGTRECVVCVVCMCSNCDLVSVVCVVCMCSNCDLVCVVLYVLSACAPVVSCDLVCVGGTRECVVCGLYVLQL